MYHVSILGLGLIGSRIARHMAGMGDKVTVWNRTLREDFPEAVPTPADAARASKVIQLYLKDRNACLEVFEQMRGALTPEHIILNHSTIDLATVGKLSLMSSAIGCTYVDCPFTGSRLPAEKGNWFTTLARIPPHWTAYAPCWSTVPGTSCTWAASEPAPSSNWSPTWSPPPWCRVWAKP